MMLTVFLLLLVAGTSFGQQVELSGNLEPVAGSLSIEFQEGDYGGEFGGQIIRFGALTWIRWDSGGL